MDDAHVKAGWFLTHPDGTVYEGNFQNDKFLG
jgi:hypothetical protein